MTDSQRFAAVVTRRTRTMLAVRVVNRDGTIKTHTYRARQRVPLAVLAVLAGLHYETFRKRARAMGIKSGRKRAARGSLGLPLARALALLKEHGVQVSR